MSWRARRHAGAHSDLSVSDWASTESGRLGFLITPGIAVAHRADEVDQGIGLLGVAGQQADRVEHLSEAALNPRQVEGPRYVSTNRVPGEPG